MLQLSASSGGPDHKFTLYVSKPASQGVGKYSYADGASELQKKPISHAAVSAETVPTADTVKSVQQDLPGLQGWQSMMLAVETLVESE